MAPLWLSCCMVRESEVKALPVNEEGLEFFDCVESEQELSLLLTKTTAAAADGDLTPVNGRTDCLTACTDEAAKVAKVLEETHEAWARRVMELGKDAVAELQWADLDTAQRMLRANIGDAKKAVAMFLQALEFRTRDHHLFRTRRCDVSCDMRVIGSDAQEHPVVYLCARSQTVPLRMLRDQFILTLELACQLATQSRAKSDGRIYLVLDMYGLSPKLNRDTTALKELADRLATVFAERIFKIVLVDFSRAAQLGWMLVKPFLSPVTREKFAFVGKAKAIDIGRTDFDGPTLGRLEQTLEINRSAESTEAERLLNARRTAVHEVPLGPPPC